MRLGLNATTQGESCSMSAASVFPADGADFTADHTDFFDPFHDDFKEKPIHSLVCVLCVLASLRLNEAYISTQRRQGAKTQGESCSMSAVSVFHADGADFTADLTDFFDPFHDDFKEKPMHSLPRVLRVLASLR